MSVCRWSSDDYQCDLYVYEAVDGWAIHVASKRHVLTEPLPERIPFTRGNVDAWLKRRVAVGKIVDRAELVPIGLPCDGETYSGLTAADCYDRMIALRDMGYYVPDGAIEAMREERDELGSTEPPTSPFAAW